MQKNLDDVVLAHLTKDIEKIVKQLDSIEGKVGDIQSQVQNLNVEAATQNLRIQSVEDKQKDRGALSNTAIGSILTAIFTSILSVYVATQKPDINYQVSSGLLILAASADVVNFF